MLLAICNANCPQSCKKLHNKAIYKWWKTFHTGESLAWAGLCSRDLLYCALHAGRRPSTPIWAGPCPRGLFFKFCFFLFFFCFSLLSIIWDFYKVSKIKKNENFEIKCLINHKMFVDSKNVHGFMKKVCLFKQCLKFWNDFILEIKKCNHLKKVCVL